MDPIQAGGGGGGIVYCFIVLTGRREIMKPNERRAAADFVQVGGGGCRVVSGFRRRVWARFALCSGQGRPRRCLKGNLKYSRRFVIVVTVLGRPVGLSLE